MENDTKSEGFEFIPAYTRVQVIEDGVLVDLSNLSREAGLRWPLAVTSGVWGVEPGQDLKKEGQRRLDDAATCLRSALKAPNLAAPCGGGQFVGGNVVSRHLMPTTCSCS